MVWMRTAPPLSRVKTIIRCCWVCGIEPHRASLGAHQSFGVSAFISSMVIHRLMRSTSPTPMVMAVPLMRVQ
nr:MAG TPA: hypothetical protein [Caudoviricetes sp.]